MEPKTRVFVGVACYEPYAEFTASLSGFLKESSKKYDISCYTVHGKKLLDAQNEIAEMFLASQAEYLLMLEDDHWGHTVQMLDDLIESGYHMCGNYYYSRHAPYVILPMPKYDFDDPTKWLMTTKKPDSKYAEMGLNGFGMTLLKREVFEKLDKPYFRPNRDKDGAVQLGYATDQDFCLRLHALGLTVGGSYSNCLTHRGIDDSNVESKRDSISYRHLAHIHQSKRTKELNKLKEAGLLNV